MPIRKTWDRARSPIVKPVTDDPCTSAPLLSVIDLSRLHRLDSLGMELKAACQLNSTCDSGVGNQMELSDASICQLYREVYLR